MSKLSGVEVFLYGLELPSLIPRFHDHDITVEHLLIITDDELIKVCLLLHHALACMITAGTFNLPHVSADGRTLRRSAQEDSRLGTRDAQVRLAAIQYSGVRQGQVVQAAQVCRSKSVQLSRRVMVG